MRLIKVYSDSYVFEEPHQKVQGKNRLTIACHGFGHIDGISQVVMDDQYRNAVQLALSIKTWTDVDKLHNIRLVSCETANPAPNEEYLRITPDLRRYPPWITSFGSQLSLFLPDILVKAYMGTIDSDCSDSFTWNFYTKHGHDDTNTMLSKYFKLYKGGLDHYHSVVFLNGRFHKQHYIE
ncbi:hypothetical protein XBP1_2480069 [Xenorhabdus bovienii str. puntauvense]|uniref:Uncharacterized protein n=1 Tax=Xenorhabdus bovienii str. puntauvense TaxID=1398201 RepID=A0A077NFJ8_XENBV|nr:hypothetical protein [Xenorhabdus bovienii]CDG97177.1 hypothetical protein XBP1_2480069 [Xenorhabdus bovienii str. puntauvense]